MKHGGFKNHRSTYQCWQDMRQRCLNPRHAQYVNYGARGIGICQEWVQDFTKFFSDMGPKPAGRTIDRIDNSGNYEPGNCRWSTPSEQRSNQRSCHYLEHQGRRMTLTAWAKEIGINPLTLSARLCKLGWSVERALSSRVLSTSEAARIGRKAQLRAKDHT